MYSIVLNVPVNLKIYIKKYEFIFKGGLGFSKINNYNKLFYIKKSSKQSILVHAYDIKFLNLYKKLLKNHIRGVLSGFSKKLKIKGLGFYFEKINDKKLLISIGLNSKVIVYIPSTIYFKVKRKKFLFLYGYNLEEFSSFCLYIRKVREPDCYKGKGIFFKNEKIQLKEGKKI